MNKKLWFILLVSTLFGIPNAQGEEAAALIEEVLTLSGTKERVMQMSVQMNAQLSQQPAKITPEAYAEIRKIVSDAYHPDRLYQSIVANFKQEFDQGRLEKLSEWWDSPLGKKITQLELEIQSSETNQEAKAFVRQIESLPFTDERVSLVKRLLRSLDLFQTLVVPGLDKELQATARLKQKEFEDDIFSPSAYVHLLFIYRSVLDDDLKQYVAFMESDTRRWFTKVLGTSLLEVTDQVTSKVNGNQ